MCSVYFYCICYIALVVWFSSSVEESGLDVYRAYILIAWWSCCLRRGWRVACWVHIDQYYVVCCRLLLPATSALFACSPYTLHMWCVFPTPLHFHPSTCKILSCFIHYGILCFVIVLCESTILHIWIMLVVCRCVLQYDNSPLLLRHPRGPCHLVGFDLFADDVPVIVRGLDEHRVYVLAW